MPVIIEFYWKDSGEGVVDLFNHYFIRNDGAVWRSKADAFQGAPEMLFDKLIEPCPHIGWRYKAASLSRIETTHGPD